MVYFVYGSWVLHRGVLGRLFLFVAAKMLGSTENVEGVNVNTELLLAVR